MVLIVFFAAQAFSEEPSSSFCIFRVSYLHGMHGNKRSRIKTAFDKYRSGFRSLFTILTTAGISTADKWRRPTMCLLLLPGTFFPDTFLVGYESIMASGYSMTIDYLAGPRNGNQSW